VNRRDFAHSLSALSLTHTERAVALLWYYRQTQAFDERTASELANDLHEEGFPKPNVTHLQKNLAMNKFTVRGKRKGSFQIDVRKLQELEDKYFSLLGVKKVEVYSNIIPSDWVKGTRIYLEKLVYQINGTYEYGFYDASAVLCRRLMESLIIEVYISAGRVHDIQSNGIFLGLDKLISIIKSDTNITLNRNAPKTMIAVKQLGDTAAHDRVYITQPQDIDDLKMTYRKMISELLNISGIKK
jgi:hypothetical protein